MENSILKVCFIMYLRNKKLKYVIETLFCHIPYQCCAYSSIRVYILLNSTNRQARISSNDASKHAIQLLSSYLMAWENSLHFMLKYFLNFLYNQSHCALQRAAYSILQNHSPCKPLDMLTLDLLYAISLLFSVAMHSIYWYIRDHFIGSMNLFDKLMCLLPR